MIFEVVHGVQDENKLVNSHSAFYSPVSNNDQINHQSININVVPVSYISAAKLIWRKS